MSAGGGLFDSLRRLLGTALETLGLRLDLFGTELEQETLRIYDAVIHAALGLLLAGLALVMGVSFLLLMLQPDFRMPALGVLTLLLGFGGWLLLRRARSQLHDRDAGLFALTLGELRRDRAGLASSTPAQPAPPAPPGSP